MTDDILLVQINPLERRQTKSVAAPENDVRDWINAWNDDPKPFR